MSVKKLLAAALVLVALGAFAGETATAPKEAAKGPEVAVFAVPGLTDAALVKSLSASLAKEAGVVSAKADAEGGKFLVTFEPGKTTPEALGKALATVSPQAKFEKVQAADAAAAKHDCSKCPSKASCGAKK
jgi:hypothetical protein